VVGKIQFGSAGYAYLVDEHGNLIAHKDGSLVLKRMNLGQLDKVREFIRNRTGSDRNPAHEGRGLLDRSVLATYAPVPDLGWAVILEEPIDAALANVEKLKRYAIVLLVVSLAVGAVIIAWVSGRMTGPIRELREGVATIGSGNLEHRTSIKTGDEIQDLAEEFNRMTDALQNSYATLEQKVEERTKEAETRSRQLSVLNKIGAAVSRSLNLEMVLNEAIEKMIETLNFDASWIYILDPSEEVLILKAYKGIGDEVAHSMDRRKRSVGISGKIFETGERFVFDGVQNDTEYNHLSSRNKLQSLGFSSSAGFPIKANEKVIGVLHLASKAGRHFAPDELQLIESIAQEIGVAAENARLFEQVNQKTAELGHMNQELQEANQAKDEFLNVMSHELRTPLNVITGYAEVLSQGVLGEIQREQMHAVKTISYQSKELLRMINEILQVGSIEAGKVKANCENVNLLDFLFELKSGYEILSKKEISLHWDIPPSLPIVWTDGEKLKHVLQNLVNNAIKFTETGGVTFSACSFSESIEFKVKDTGIGMPQDMLPSIFQMFRQLDSSSTRSYGGSGVGLYIVKKFVDLLGGKIEVESVLGKGSTFTITLSLNAAEKFNASQADLEAKLAS
jgi:signal transduction histidine kinase